MEIILNKDVNITTVSSNSYLCDRSKLDDQVALSDAGLVRGAPGHHDHDASEGRPGGLLPGGMLFKEFSTEYVDK